MSAKPRSWLDSLPADEQEIAAVATTMRAIAECATKWGWPEDRFTLMARICFRWAKDGEISDPDETTALGVM